MYNNKIKRIIDIIFVLFLIPILVLFTCIVSILIKLEDKGPIIYKSKRLGYKGELYTIYKFRTMKVNSEDIRNKDGSTYNGQFDKRITKVGQFLRKTSIDELPQLINVLIGNMSIVGPRPDLPDAIAIYSEFEKQKLNCKPGITGFNQAYYRNSIEQSKKFSNDVYYVNNISFILDFKIVFKTIESIVLKKNIHTN